MERFDTSFLYVRLLSEVRSESGPLRPGSVHPAYMRDGKVVLAEYPDISLYPDEWLPVSPDVFFDE